MLRNKYLLLSTFFLIIFTIQYYYLGQQNLKYSYSGVILERAMIYDFLLNQKEDKLRQYMNSLMPYDLDFIENNSDIFIEIKYCRVWNNIKNNVVTLVKNETYAKINTICNKSNKKDKIRKIF